MLNSLFSGQNIWFEKQEGDKTAEVYSACWETGYPRQQECKRSETLVTLHQEQI